MATRFARRRSRVRLTEHVQIGDLDDPRRSTSFAKFGRSRRHRRSEEGSDRNTAFDAASYSLVRAVEDRNLNGGIPAADQRESNRLNRERPSGDAFAYSPSLAVCAVADAHPGCYGGNDDDRHAGVRGACGRHGLRRTLVRAMWAANQGTFATADVVRALRACAEVGATVARDMDLAGVGILTGCDTMVAEFCVHDELEALVRGGMTPLAALRASTLNPARYFGRDQTTGSVAPGKTADVVLLDTNRSPPSRTFAGFEPWSLRAGYWNGPNWTGC